MKFNLTYPALVLLTSLSLASCQKTDEITSNAGVSNIAVKLDLGGVATKAIEDEFDAVANPTLSSIQLYFTDASGLIVSSYNVSSLSTDDDLKIWSGLTGNSGVRFVGLTGVSRVYVTANMAGTYDDTISSISALNDYLIVDNDFAEIEQSAVPYVGACEALTATSTLTNTISENEVVISTDGYDGQDYYAELTIRPIISRLEVKKVGIKPEGTTYFKSTTVGETNVTTYEVCTESEAEYSVAWSNFDADLVGVYMSNFYTNHPLLPATTSVNGWTLFETIGFTSEGSSIDGGVWRGLADYGDFDAVSCYANYDGSAYSAITDVYVSNSGTTKYLFDGTANENNVVVPFNFAVPYDVTETETSINALSDAVTPSLHFQLQQTDNDIVVGDIMYKDGDSWTAVTDEALIAEFKDAVAWPTSIDNGIAYVNVTKFTTDAAGTTEMTLKPGVIYRVEEVVIEPVNLSVSTLDSSIYNINVYVTVVGFTEENVYPVFN